jgi:hypothetical protein
MTEPHASAPGCARWTSCKHAKPVTTDRGFLIQRCDLTAAHPSGCTASYLRWREGA